MKFVRRTRSRAGAQEHPLRVVLLDRKFARFWHNEIQPYIRVESKSLYRPDERWNWPLMLRLLPRVELLSGRRCFGYAVVVESASGRPIPVALALLVEAYALLDEREPSTFLWFVASAPKTALAALKAPMLSQLGQILIDCCLVTSLNAGLAGRMSLHADPGGDAFLPRYYSQTCGLLRVPMATTLRWPRTNDDRYFYTTPALAQKLMAAFDNLR